MTSDENIFFGASNFDLVIDSGSTDHVITQKEWFKNYRKIKTVVNKPHGRKAIVEGVGEVEISAKDSKGANFVLELKQVLNEPGYKTNLMSTSK